MKEFRFPKWAVLALAAAVFLPLVTDWVAPGDGLRLAASRLGGGMSGAADSANRMFPLWGWLVGLAGKDITALGAISVGAGLVCVWMVTLIAGSVFGAAVRTAKEKGAKGANEFPFAEGAAVLLAGLGFALTPGLLVAATRVSPLMVTLAPPLAAVALAAGVAAGGASSQTTASGTLFERLKKGKGRLLLAILLLGYSAYELILARRLFAALAFPALWVWLAVGVMPAVVIAWCVRKRWLLARRAQFFAFGGWAVVVLVMGAVNFTLGGLNAGRAANRIAGRIIANAGDKAAVVSDGTLDALLFFMLPQDKRLISLARERDPAYGRELASWIKNAHGAGAKPPETNPNAPNAKHPASSTNLVEDLVFAAELGPRALIDEWVKLDKPGFEAAVATVPSYFPTREKWDDACAELDGMRADEPLGRYLRHLLAVCGNALGCRMIEQDDLKGAWDVFWTISEKIDKENYTALINLTGLAERGLDVSKTEKDSLKRKRTEIEGRLKTWERIVRAARAGGRLYADPEDVAKYEKAKREAAKKRGLSPEAQQFIETVAAAPNDPKSGKAAQEAIHKAIREGKVRIDTIGGRLITIDLALGDRENAEKDALDVLKIDRHEPTANATLGSLAGAQGDYERAERYLRRAISTGRASIAAKNDLAYSLMKMGRLDEAEPFAREAVKAYGEAWALRETLAAILIRKGNANEGEHELAKAEELAAKMGIPVGNVTSIAIDHALLLKAKGDLQKLKIAKRTLKARKDLTDAERREVDSL